MIHIAILLYTFTMAIRPTASFRKKKWGAHFQLDGLRVENHGRYIHLQMGDWWVPWLKFQAFQGSGCAVDETDVTLTVQTRQAGDTAKA